MNRHLMATTRSHLSSLRRLGVCIMLLAVPVFLASSAYADVISVGFQEANVNGGAITTVASSITGAVNVGPISYGTFSVNQANAQDDMVLGPPGLLNSNILDVSTAKVGVLTVWVTAQGLSHTGVQNFISSFAVNALSGGIALVTENTYFSVTNALYGGTLLDSASFTGIGIKGPDTSPGLTLGTYSVTEQYVIFDTAGTMGNDNLTIDLSGTGRAVPEPASLGLIGTSLLSIFALKFRR